MPRVPLVCLVRRRLLHSLGAASAVALAAPATLLAAPGEQRRLSFEHTHTGERLTTVYWADGQYRPEALSRLDRLLRDHRTGESHRIDRDLFDLLNDLRLATGARAPFQIISGFRSPKTNASLKAQGRGVARHSLHMDGKAIDVRVAGVSTRVLRDAAIELRRGGVGYYGGPDFVHVDTGRVRRW